MLEFNPFDWYWLASDGRLFSSARQALIADDDADYLAWTAAGHLAQRWPTDESGEQTTDALQGVLTPYGMFADLIGYAADRRWRKEVGGIVVGGVPVTTDDRSKLMIAGARIKADANPEFTTNWKTGSGFILLDAATIIALSDAVLAHVDSCFETEGEVLAAIDAGTITTREQIDAAFQE
jgi:hypothetical protein